MSLVCVFAASKGEAEPIRKLAEASGPAASHTGRRLCRSGRNEFLVITDGMGPKAARAKALQALAMTPPSNDPKQAANHTPDAVLVLGLCGSLSASLPETRVVVYTDCLSTEAQKPSLRCAESITNRLIDLLVSGKIPCDPVTGITSARIAVTIEEKVALARSGARVVDMESYEILDVAAQAGIPGAVLRVVSDSLEREMPDFNRALGRDGAYRSGKRRLRKSVAHLGTGGAPVYPAASGRSSGLSSSARSQQRKVPPIGAARPINRRLAAKGSPMTG